jgi:hypothetical protein
MTFGNDFHCVVSFLEIEHCRTGLLEISEGEILTYNEPFIDTWPSKDPCKPFLEQPSGEAS